MRREWLDACLRVDLLTYQCVHVLMCCESGVELNHAHIKSEANHEGLTHSEIRKFGRSPAILLLLSCYLSRY